MVGSCCWVLLLFCYVVVRVGSGLIVINYNSSLVLLGFGGGFG